MEKEEVVRQRQHGRYYGSDRRGGCGDGRGDGGPAGREAYDSKAARPKAQEPGGRAG